MMKKRYFLLGAVGFVIFYISRPWLPMLYWGDGIEVEINLPAHLVPSVGGEYSSSSCQSLTTSDFSWINGRRGGEARLEKISDTQYRAKVYFNDFGPCGWRLTSVGWRLEYKDAGAVLTGAAGASGGGNTIVIGSEAYFSDSERNSSLYSDAKVMVINRSLVPYILPDPDKDTKGFFIGSDNESGYDPHYYYNPYKHAGQAKIVYNVMVDESSLKGLTADEAYRLQEERLARERKEKQENEEARRQKIRDEIAEIRRQRELRESREAKASSAVPVASVSN
jgi:hypothetical protein